MPKGSHFHPNHDGRMTDKKFRPEDEGIYRQEKQEFQQSEKDKKADAIPREELISEQDKNSEG